MTSLADAALAYARAGWAVFPCRPKSKVPAAAHGCKDATADQATVAAWWARWPRANIGLATGGTCGDVLDVDGPEADDALQAAWEAAGCPPGFLSGEGEVGPAVRTAKGHHLYVAPTGLGNRARFTDGCDWRGHGGYVIAPPSVHPSDAVYAWVDGHGPDVALPAAPGWLLGLLNPPPPPPRPRLPATRLSQAGYGEAALRGEVAQVLAAPVGARNHTLNAAAFSLGQLVAGGALDAATAADALVEAGLSAGLGAHEVEGTVRSGLRAGIAEPRRAG